MSPNVSTDNFTQLTWADDSVHNLTRAQDDVMLSRRLLNGTPEVAANSLVISTAVWFIH